MYRTKQHVLYLLLPVLLLSLLYLNAHRVIAQDSSADPVTTVTPNDVKEVAKELWCPLCSGVRLDACELKACEQMREVIADKLVAGEDTQEIKNYFVAQYGPQVLGEPPMEGFNWLAWILPVVALVGGGVFVWYRTRGMISSKQPDATPPAAAPDDEMSQRLEEELKHYD